MPVRKIPKSFRAVTGRFSSLINNRCVSYESKLERDYFLMLEFDRTVQTYEEQPVKIQGEVNGRQVTYTLDCLVQFKGDRKPLLVELKYQTELDEKSELLERKIACAQQYSQDQGFDFQVVTDKDVYDSRMDNYRLLYRFARPPVQIGTKRKHIREIFGEFGELPLKELVNALNEQCTVQAEYLPSIWHMIFLGEIETDLNRPLGFNSILRSDNG